MTNFMFHGGEVVRLRRDREDVKAGCCGIVWGVYDLTPVQYEATFVTDGGEQFDVVFEAEDVEEVVDVRETPFPESLRQIKQMLDTNHRKC
jgi:hypothetical protein